MGSGKKFIMDLNKYDDNNSKLGGKRVIRPVTIEDGAIFMYDSTIDAFRAIIMPSGADVLFRDARPIPQDIGGWKKGDIINNIPLSEVVRTLLFPYVLPSFSYFNITGLPALEIGDTAGVCVFTWGLNVPTNVVANTIKILKDNTLILQNLNTSPVSMDLGTRNIIPKKEIFTIVASNTKGGEFRMTASVAWNIAMYYGVNSKESLMEDEIEAMAPIMVSDLSVPTLSFMGPGYKYIAIPDNLITRELVFKDAVTKFDVPMLEIKNISITNKNGITNTYTLYRSYYLLNGDINIVIN